MVNPFIFQPQHALDVYNGDCISLSNGTSLGYLTRNGSYGMDE